tara:strand:- start:737 stop:1528 length:792 start_codon:yes stop_codon:yes gene_type:complete
MDSKVSDAINNYYKLKKKYDKQIIDDKRKIINNDNLTKKEKRLKFKQIKKKCVNCGNRGGTIFSNNNNTLTAVCGNITPCKLNININRGNYTNIYNTELFIKDDIDSIKKNIMMLKLDLLFNYSDETIVLKEFKKEKKDISDLTQSLISIRKEYISIVDNIDDRQSINDLNIKLSELKEQLKTIANNNNINFNINYINDMVELYIRDIKPVATEIQKKNYKHMELITNTESNSYILNQNKFNNSDLYVPINNNNIAKIVTYKK